MGHYDIFFFIINIDTMTGSRIGGHGSPSRDRLVYVSTCLVGHHVDVQVKSGSIYSGIFHATSAEKDFGMFLFFLVLLKSL